jgi:DNA-binding response OmpR family regulator
VVLDRDLPGMHGDDMCRTLIREGDGSTRILMLTGATTVRDRATGGLSATVTFPTAT